MTTTRQKSAVLLGQQQSAKSKGKWSGCVKVSEEDVDCKSSSDKQDMHTMPCCVPVEAATFAKAKNVFRAVHAASPPKAGPSQRELRAQLRAERIKQGKAGTSSADRGREEANMTELEAAASLVDLMAHERLQPGKHPGCDHYSQKTGLSPYLLGMERH